jgi:hypothetical protein
MLSARDWLWMQEQAAKVRTDRSFDIELRRGSTVIAAQEARIEAVFQRGYRMQSEAARESRQAVIVFGDMSMDVQIDDRFTLDDVIYRIVFVDPNRDIDTQAEAVAVE